MVERAEDKAFPFDYLQDETQEIAKRFGATKTPHVYILKRQQKIFTVEYIGAIDDNAFEPDGVHQKFAEYALDQLTKDLPVSLKETKAVGCSIKWKK
jgi:peroxiredoxin